MTNPGENDVLRILHTSDWHLGCPFSQFRPFERTRLQQARFQAVEHAFGEARAKQAHAVLGAGDLFDDATPGEPVWRRLVRVLEQHGGGCPVVLLPGNHDPLVEGSVWQASHPFRRALPPFVHVVDRDDFCLEIAEGAKIYARPTRSRVGSDDPVLALPAREPGDESIRIGLVHGQTFRWDNQDAHHPVGPESARARGFDYLALGDTHGFRDLHPGGSPAIVYSGSPEPMKFGEEDAGHVALVHVRRRSHRVRVEKLRTGVLRWRRLELASVEDVRGLFDEDHHDAVLSLLVRGRFDPEALREVEQKLDQLEGDEDIPGLAAAIRVVRKLELDDSHLFDLLEDAPEELREAARLLIEKRDKGDVTPVVAERAMCQLIRIAQEVAR